MAEFKLQWGHAFVSVETKAAETLHELRCDASMGPRFCKRGNPAHKTWQHPLTLLQWGHAFVSVETCERLQRFADHSAASMGPRFCKRGNRLHVSLLLL